MYSSRKTFTVHMITEDHQVFTEPAYQGYGVFGGKDIYVLIGNLNKCPHKEEEEIRNWTFNFIYKPEYGTFSQLAKRGIKVPKIVRHLPKNHSYMSSVEWKQYWNSLSFPQDCPDQGYFYK